MIILADIENVKSGIEKINYIDDFIKKNTEPQKTSCFKSKKNRNILKKAIKTFLSKIIKSKKQINTYIIHKIISFFLIVDISEYTFTCLYYTNININ